MNKEKNIELLNQLIEINNDRIEGYETASKETQEEDLKSLFSKLIQNSKRCRAELVEEVHLQKGVPTERTKITGKFFRVWMDVKAALTAGDRKTILDSCVFGEETIVETYKKILTHNFENITDKQLTFLKAQYALLKMDLATVKSIRDLLEV